MEVINLQQKFSLFNVHYQPKVVAELNGQHIKLVKLKGEFVWHHHANEDELFFVVRGKLKIEFRDRVVKINENEMMVVPRGIEHKPVADEEVWVMLFEPATTLNTGNAVNERTQTLLEHI